MPNVQQNQGTKKLEFDVEPVEFDGILRSKIMTTIDLSKVVNSLIKPVFSDWEGSTIELGQYGNLILTIFFKDKGQPLNGQVKAIQPVVGQLGRTASPIQRIQNMNLRNKAKTYDLTPQAKELLSEFIPTKRGKEVNWNNHLFERTENNYGSYSIHVALVGCDLTRILRKIYGGKDDRDRIEYSIDLIRPMGMEFGYNSGNYLVRVSQLNTSEVQKLVSTIGLIPAGGQIPMVRE